MKILEFIKRKRSLIIVFGLALLFVGCQSFGEDSEMNTDGYGFFTGLAHSIAIPYIWWLRFFTHIEFYNANNNGWPYDLGFALGFYIFFGIQLELYKAKFKKK